MSSNMPRWLADLLHEEHARAGHPDGTVILQSDLDHVDRTPLPSDRPQRETKESDLPSNKRENVSLPSDSPFNRNTTK